MINAGIGAFSGDWSGVGAGIGGMVGGYFGWQAGVAGGALFSDAVSKFVVGFTVGAIEFGAAGFGAGFGGALAGGASLGDAATAGLIGGGIGAVAGGIIQGTYMAGWQDVLHGASKEDIAFEKVKGRLPTSAEREVLESYFPRLKGTRYKITGGIDGRYNCISWTLDRTDVWTNPTGTVGGMDQLYASAGYKESSEKNAIIALFVKHSTPTHGAKRIEGSLYESKLGSSFRIVHPLRALEGEQYGDVHKFYGK